MNLNTKEDIQKAYKAHFEDDNFDLKHETQMLMFRFLSEIERLSEEKGYTRKELAEKIGTSASYITQLFRGNKTINLETIAKFQNIFNIKFEINTLQKEEKNSFSDFNPHVIKREEPQSGVWVYHNLSADYNTKYPNVAKNKLTKPLTA